MMYFPGNKKASNLSNFGALSISPPLLNIMYSATGIHNMFSSLRTFLVTCQIDVACALNSLASTQHGNL